MTLQEIITFVNFVIRKAQVGETMTPEQYNVLLSGFNIQIFHDEFQQVEVMAKASGIPTYRALHTSGPLKRFIEHVETYTASGILTKTLLPGYVQQVGIISSYLGAFRDIDVITEEELNNKRSSMLEVSLSIKPVCVDYGSSLSFWPKDVGVVPNGKVEISYLRMPATPYYDFCISETTGRYYYMPAGSYIKMTSQTSWALYSSANVLLVSNVYNVGSRAAYRVDLPYDDTEQLPYDSASVELDWDDRFHMRFVQALLQATAPSLSPDMLSQYAKEMPK